MKKNFFDRKKIKRRVDVRTRRVLSKFGSFVRRSAQHSIRPSNNTSRPGHPPFSHSGKLRKKIYFMFDPKRRSVVIGPIIYPGKTGRALPALEYGGKTDMPSGDTVKIEARPFMGPAFSKNLVIVPALWSGTIK
ncbi:MAG: hypothetical protein FWH27_05145 [Planctomycetaceae bacterium]|nr:hypothetical protein [Planctomycetaceae bacterium]